LVEQHSRAPYALLLTSVAITFLVKLSLTEEAVADPLANYSGFVFLFFVFSLINIGEYFSNGISNKESIKWVVILAISCSILAIIAVEYGDRFIFPRNDFEWIGPESLMLMMFIVTGLTFYAVIASPIFVVRPSDARSRVARFVILGMVIVSMLPYAWKKMNDFKYLTIAPIKTIAYLSKQGDTLPVYVLGNDTFNRITLLSKFSGGYLDEHSITFSEITKREIPEIVNGYILAYENEIADILKTWWKIGNFGILGKERIVIYKVISERKALNYLANEDKTDQSNLFGAFINAGLFCEGYWRWLQDIAAEEGLNSVPYNSEANCFARSPSMIELGNLYEWPNIQGYITFPGSATVGDQSAFQADISQISLPVWDKRIISIDLYLEPNSIYLYSINIKSISPTITLYWHTSSAEDYLEMRSYPEWTNVSLLIRTPNWNTSQPVSLSPVLFDHLDIVSLRDLYFGKLVLEK
jgi:hypothetical protein